MLLLPHKSLPLMRNGDSFSAASETRSLAMPVLRSGLPLLPTPELLSWQLSEQDPLEEARPYSSCDDDQ